MGKTHRRNDLDQQYGCFEDFRRRSNFTLRFGLTFFDDPVEEKAFYDWDYQHDKKRWDTRRRDGGACHYPYGGTGASKYYRQLTNRLIRSGTRQNIHRGIRDGDWDDLVWPTDWEGKQFIWSVW